MRAAVLTVSDGCNRGERTDRSGPLLLDGLRAAGHQVVEFALLPDEAEQISDILRLWCDGRCDVVLTTGGTGFTPRDVTPEATRAVIERDAPGIAELLRADAYPRVPTAVLSRGVAGIRGATLIINLPGSTGAVRDGLRLLLPLLPHAAALLRNEPVEHTPSPTEREAPADDSPQSVVEIETNIDDMSPEAFEPLTERLWKVGALDVFLTPIQMKKGRPATRLSVLAHPDRLQQIADALFAESSAFGLRYSLKERITLRRSWVTVQTRYGAVRVKIGERGGKQVTASPEYEDVKAAATAHAVSFSHVYSAAVAAYESVREQER